MAEVLPRVSPLDEVLASAAAEVYAFGPVRVDVARHLVSRDGQPVVIAPKAFELLLLFLRSGGRVLSRQELIAALWPDTFVEEANLWSAPRSHRWTVASHTGRPVAAPTGG